MKFTNLSQAEKFLYAQIKPQRQKTPANTRLDQVKKLLKELGSPQEKMKVIHIAGTSGKGSTAYLTSLILHTLGFKTGLHLSPHLIDLRERFQINQKLIDKKSFLAYLNKLIPLVEKQTSKKTKPNYFALLNVIAYYIFAQEEVDYAVVETGLGGLYDSTNVIENKDKLSLITKIGLDHQEILGETIKKITYQKAGIINNNSSCLSIEQAKEAEKVVNRVVLNQKAQIDWIRPKENFKAISVAKTKTKFSFSYNNEEVEIDLGLIGRHQIENASLALAAVKVLSQRDNFNMAWEEIKRTLLKANFPGRLEIFTLKDKSIIIDGAHNAQKIAALTTSLKKLFPNKKFTFLLAFKKNKAAKEMIKKIIPIAEKVVITTIFSYHDIWQDLSQDPTKLEKVFHKEGFKNTAVCPNPKHALDEYLITNDNIVITGSLYLVGELYPKVQKLTSGRQS